MRGRLEASPLFVSRRDRKAVGDGGGSSGVSAWREKGTMQVPVRWTTPEDAEFRGREVVLVGDGGVERIPVPDGLVLCDACGRQVEEGEAVALIEGNAYCADCAGQYFGVGEGQTVAVVEE